VPPFQSSSAAGIGDPDQPGYPFRGPGLLVRVAPFGAIALLAEASLALSPGPAPAWQVAISLVLLGAVAAAFALPWARLPGWLPVLVPLAYTGSVLALILAAGSASGVGIVLLVPLIWTALYHRRWESGCILAAIVAVEVVISLTPVTVAADVIARRVIFWAALGTVLAVATHELRERGSRARSEAAGLHAQLTDLTLLRDRDRIAADLQDKVIQQVFSVGLSLQSTAMLASQPRVREGILASADALDQVLRLTRDAVFGLEQRLQGRGLRAEIGALFEQVSPAPEISFTGPVDGALDPALASQLVEALQEALQLMTPHAAPSRFTAVSTDTCYTAEIEATWPDAEIAPLPAWIEQIASSTPGPGISVTVEQAAGGTRLTWSVPLLQQPG